MTSRHLRLTFPEAQVAQPVIYHVVKDFNVIPSIRRAAIENHFGWMIVEFKGEVADLDAAQAYLESIGVEISQAEGDILAG
jgi:ABC-type methionine transport system ATPase subunit